MLSSNGGRKGIPVVLRQGEDAVASSNRLNLGITGNSNNQFGGSGSKPGSPGISADSIKLRGGSSTPPKEGGTSLAVGSSSPENDGSYDLKKGFTLDDVDSAKNKI
jgi:hypothetical protein